MRKVFIFTPFLYIYFVKKITLSIATVLCYSYIRCNYQKM
ncbi:hypothetical protein GCWU000282_01115 [Catonella morbi ATCC 51271]|uniref:Uncharacterized protein n=1 Tax=Catonella morbi ATCC 51271 TaxID=592026 RepID=V2Y779_9FIRM|nr:hypothetical protein GCWU000282_01115 [Catonella morbi ATCC 51271]